jgi:hypothetical protein
MAPESVPEPVDQEALITDCWRILDDLVRTGRATLRGGQEITAKDPLVATVEKLAAMKRPQERRMAEVEGFRVGKTGKAPAGQPGAA